MKVKGIELMKMIVDGKVNENTKVNIDNYYSCSLDFVFEDGRNIFKWLDEYFEILEDKTEEIEEIQNFTCLTKGNNGEIIKLLNELSICYGEKLNELTRAINQIKKDKQLDTSKETHCMTD